MGRVGAVASGRLSQMQLSVFQQYCATGALNTVEAVTPAVDQWCVNIVCRGHAYQRIFDTAMRTKSWTGASPVMRPVGRLLCHDLKAMPRVEAQPALICRHDVHKQVLDTCCPANGRLRASQHIVAHGAHSTFAYRQAVSFSLMNGQKSHTPVAGCLAGGLDQDTPHAPPPRLSCYADVG